MHWMEKNNKEDPLYEDYDALLDIAYAHDATLSMGDGFRPGTVMDATDGAQAAHSADIAKGLPGAIERDRRMSMARRDLDWEGMMAQAIDPETARARVRLSADKETCTMCGELCAVKLSRRSFQYRAS